MNVFISGGCKNGKSMYAQNLQRTWLSKAAGLSTMWQTMIPAGR